MSPTVITPRFLSGATAVRAAQSLRPPKRSKVPVPFPWDLPPENSKMIYQQGVIASPAQGVTPAVVVSYQVPDGFYFTLRGRINVFTGVTVEGSGDVAWTTDVDTPVGITSPQGYPLQGMADEPFQVGSLTGSPFPIIGRLVFEPNDIIRVKVLNTSVGVGAPNYFISVLMGWLWPLER